MVKKGLLIRNFDSVRKTGDLTVKTVRLTEGGREILETTEKLTKNRSAFLTF